MSVNSGGLQFLRLERHLATEANKRALPAYLIFSLRCPLLYVSLFSHGAVEDLNMPEETSETKLLRKDQLEARLHNEKKLIEDGLLKEDNPLDFSDDFKRLCEASRRGDLKTCQEMITAGVNINARDAFDYTPLILVCSCRADARYRF